MVNFILNIIKIENLFSDNGYVDGIKYLVNPIASLKNKIKNSNIIIEYRTKNLIKKIIDESIVE
jgi:hypothetical protein